MCRADPRLTDWDLLLDNIRDLRAGREAEVPHYDFKQSKRTGYTRVPVPHSRVVIVEGIYALSARLRRVICHEAPAKEFKFLQVWRRIVPRLFQGSWHLAKQSKQSDASCDLPEWSS